MPSSKSRHRDRDGKRHPYFDKHDNEPIDNAAPSYKISKSAEILNKLQQEPEGYAECYPGQYSNQVFYIKIKIFFLTQINSYVKQKYHFRVIL